MPDCPRCGLHFEREEGYWTGALAINIAVAGIVFLLVFVPWVAATIPESRWQPILAVLVPIDDHRPDRRVPVLQDDLDGSRPRVPASGL